MSWLGCACDCSISYISAVIMTVSPLFLPLDKRNKWACAFSEGSDQLVQYIRQFLWPKLANLTKDEIHSEKDFIESKTHKETRMDD